MRLINIETLQLQRFPEDSIPPYAILSHVWGHQDDECRFQDFNDTKQHSEQLRSKRGYAKIINFCRKAQEHGHTWAWADTVCIDKTSYEELNTAINCMFAWYEQSEVCFAYLDNVEYCGPVIAIKRSSWFQRGWTLQEFIAPVRLSFFSREWTFLFARDDTSRGLESIAHGLVVKKRADLLAGYTAAEKM
ncbi:het domain protein [Colletotrichum chrysophilum]|uniref:Het domain protein n=1 Tax=Colletotrichum chrysophilum TaxID=1836956 RepID=A0AAD9AEN7_9PEZI|nr:het domain protein [Colletotrichum chrysophilum]